MASPLNTNGFIEDLTVWQLHERIMVVFFLIGFLIGWNGISKKRWRECFFELLISGVGIFFIFFSVMRLVEIP